MAAGRLVGTSVLRLEDNRLLLGQGRFVADISVSRPLFMSIVRSKKAHAIIDKIETKTAQLSPGVRRVVVGSELVDSVAPLPSIDMAGEGVAAPDGCEPPRHAAAAACSSAGRSSIFGSAGATRRHDGRMPRACSHLHEALLSYPLSARTCAEGGTASGRLKLISAGIASSLGDFKLGVEQSLHRVHDR